MNKINNLLSKLFPQDISTQTWEQLQPKIADWKHQYQHNNKPLFSENDVILITYADSLLQDEVPPLQVLHDFAQHWLKDSISAIHFLPFFPFSSDDGFSVIDYYAIRDDLGTWQDVQNIGHDFDLMFDAVFNHMSAESDWFTSFLQGDSDFKSMFVTASPDDDLSGVTRPRTSPLLTPFKKEAGETVHVWTTFSADQVDINFKDPDTLVRMIEVLLFYIVDMKARFIRLDAIAYLWKVIGTSSIHLPQTHTAIQLMRAILDEIAPNVLLVTETNVPHQENISYYGDGYNEAQMVYNFTLPPLLFHTMLSQDTTKLQAWVKTLEVPSERTTFFNFTASHDGIGVRPVEGILTIEELNQMIDCVEKRGGQVSYKRNADGSQSPYELNITYVDAITDSNIAIELQIKQFLITQGIMLCLAGIPGIYIHSILGSRNDFNGVKQTGRARSINRERLQASQVKDELKQSTSFRSGIFSGYQHLLTTRKQYSAFHPNTPQTVIDFGNSSIFALLRGNAPERILTVFNVSNNVHIINLATFEDSSYHDLLTDTTQARNITLNPYQIMWLKIQ